MNSTNMESVPLSTNTIDFDLVYGIISDNTEQCEGCQMLNKNLGGENQMEHMYPGGCLYSKEWDFDEDNCSLVKTNLNIERTDSKCIIKCVVCSTEENIENPCDKTFICDSCNTKEDTQRELRYQSFVVKY